MKKADLINTLTKNIKTTEFNAKLANKKVSVSRKDATEIVEMVLDIMQTGLKEDKIVDLFGFFKMSVGHQDEYIGRNPQTGEPMNIPAKDVPRCKFSKTLKEYLNA